NGDWWELTNTGSSAVSLNNYKWDDTPTPADPSASNFPAGITIQPGESIIILNEEATNVAAWRAAWGLSASTVVINTTQFAAANPGGEVFSGLSDSGDEVNLYNAGGSVVASVTLGASIAGKSLAFHRDGTPVTGTNSAVGKDGAFASSLGPSDVGSPGDTRIHFTSSPVRYGKSSYQYAIAAIKPGFAAATFSASGLPPFLTLTAGSSGKATLASNRTLTLADAGDYLVEITTTSSGTSTVQEFLITVLNPLPSVVLNEYNGVSSTNFLNGGNVTTDEDGGAASVDSHFGRVVWNGGQWVEFVVVGLAPVDVRGWTVEIGTNNGTGFVAHNKLVFSNHANWQAVPNGTILTFIDRTTAQGGLDTGIAIRDNSATTGDIWTNIWMGDPTYLTYTSDGFNGYTNTAGVLGGILIDNNNTQFRVKNTAGQIVYGPAGEGVAPVSGLNSKEVLELEAHPTVLVSPTDTASASTRGYDTGASGSTFGSPNSWTEGVATVTQQFNVIPPAEIAVEQPAGAVVADGGSVNYGSLATGANVSRTFTIRNLGIVDLTGLTITKDGANAADFTVTASPVAPVAGPTGTTTFTVKFAPTTAGSKTAGIHIASNDADEASYDITLKGSAFVKVPEISVQQPVGSELTDGKTKKSFGTVKIGKKSAVKTFTIRNAGTADLTGLSIAVKGKQAKEFTVTKLSKTTLASGATTTFKVTFKPTAKGTRNASIQIKSNDANENPFDIPVTGSGAKK
ncbi:MAG: choice-of-anchor D domain-containing protein, partial [Verrucomicrobiaceae bacterium]